MKISWTVFGRLLAASAFFVAGISYPQAPTCPYAANGPPLPMSAGVYMLTGQEWIPLSNPKFVKCGFWTGCGDEPLISNFRSAAAGNTAQYLEFINAKATHRTTASSPVFLVREHPSWASATFIHIEPLKGSASRHVPISGEKLAQNRQEAVSTRIDKASVCLKANADLSAGEYVLALYPAGTLPSKRGNFFDFAIDEVAR